MKYVMAVFVTAVTVFVAATVYYKGLPTFPAYNPNPVSTQTSVSFTPSPTPIDETSAIVSAVRAGLVIEHGQDAASMNISVSKIEGGYAQGGATASGGGGAWFAAKVNGNWVLVWDGNGQINCSNLTRYPNFPTDMIPECWNETTRKLVTR